MAGNQEVKVFNDPVHGHMEFHPLLVAIIDTPEFQRLRYLKQLGAGYFVYPGACHNRFEHSLGVCHLAGLLVEKLQRKQNDLGITDQDVLCVQIAGLCHDLGHGPFSHVFDNSFIPRAMKRKAEKEDEPAPKKPKEDEPATEKPKGDEPAPKKWKHEDASIRMFEYMVDKNEGLKAAFERYKIDDTKREFIKQLIKKPKPEVSLELTYGPEHKKAFLYEIVANERNGVDVDKWEYFKRDSLQLGIGNAFDHMRLISLAKVIKHKGQWQICFRDKEAFNMYEMFHTRYALHRQAYQHRVVQAVEIMLVDALLEYDDYLRGIGKKPLSECIESMMDYVNLTDAVFHDILRAEGEGENLKKAQEILNNIQRRKLYPCVGESMPITKDTEQMLQTSDEVEEKLLQNAEEERKQKKSEVRLERTHIVIQFVDLNFGRRQTLNPNPVDDIRFYSKSKPDEAVSIKAHEVSYMIPHKWFEERRVRVFFRPTQRDPDEKERKERLRAACERFLQEMRDQETPTAASLNPDGAA